MTGPKGGITVAHVAAALVDKQRLSQPFDRLDCALQLEDLGKHNLEHLLHIDRVRRRREHQRRLHGPRILSRLLVDLLLLFRWQSCENIVLGAHQEGVCRL